MDSPAVEHIEPDGPRRGHVVSRRWRCLSERVLDAEACKRPNEAYDQPSRPAIFHAVPSPNGLTPNGSRLSCGRNARGRKAVERQKKRLAGEATQVFPTCERPSASSAC